MSRASHGRTIVRELTFRVTDRLREQPTFTPIGSRRRIRNERSRFSANSSLPLPLKPRRLTTPRSAASRNMRGRGFPGCRSAVTVPSSAKPNPSSGQRCGATPSLSKPAASPIGFGKSMPRIRCASRSEVGGSGRGSPWARAASTMLLGALRAADRELVSALGVETKEKAASGAIERCAHRSIVSRRPERSSSASSS